MLTPAPKSDERRGHERHSFNLKTTCKLIDLAGRLPWQGECRDLSYRGLRMVMERAFQPQTMLLIEFQGPNQLSVRSVLARVMWSEKNPEGGWVLGCALVHGLQEAELSGLLEEACQVTVEPVRAAPAAGAGKSSGDDSRLGRLMQNVHGPGGGRAAVATIEPLTGFHNIERLRQRLRTIPLAVRLPSRQKAVAKAARYASLKQTPTVFAAPRQRQTPTTFISPLHAAATARDTMGGSSEVTALVPTNEPAETNAPEPPVHHAAATARAAEQAARAFEQADADRVNQELFDHLTEQLEADQVGEARTTLLALLERNPGDRECQLMLSQLNDQLDLPEQTGELRCFTGHRGEVNSVAFSPDSEQVLSGSGGEVVDGFYTDGEDQSLRRWDALTGKETGRFTAPASPVLSVTCSPNGTHLLVACRNGQVHYVDRRDFSFHRKVASHKQMVLSAALSPDGQWVLTGCDDGVVRLWNLLGKRVRRYEGHSRAVTGVAFSPDGGGVASASLDGSVRLWDTETGTPRQCLTGHAKGVLAAVFSPDGRQVLSASADATVRLWDAASGTLVHTFAGHTAGVTSVVFTPDGTQALSGSSDGSVRLWDVGAGTELQCFTGHTAGVKCLAISSGGQRFLSGSADRTVRLWRLPV
ncbi:MAG: PilZ domain-containing protein, partial [Planctomycetia bacterium]|nr:PilZ domain-containing protein [Planctomycetia bacterium]